MIRFLQLLIVGFSFSILSPQVAHSQFSSSRMKSVVNNGDCITPNTENLTVVVTSQRITNSRTGHFFGLFDDPTVGVSAEFDFVLTSPLDSSDKRTFPAAKTVAVDGPNAGDIIRVTNQFSPLRAVNLLLGDPNPQPFPSIDASVFLIRKAADSEASKFVSAIEKIGGSVPTSPWTAGLQLYGNLASAVVSFLTPPNNNPNNDPYANINLVIFSGSGSTCGNGFLHDGVNVIIGEPIARSSPRQGETFLTLADLENNCIYSTDDVDPEIKFVTMPPNGVCGSTIPGTAKILGNPMIVFRAVGIQKKPQLVLLNSTAPLPKITASLQLSARQMSALQSFANRNRLSLDASEIGDAVSKQTSAAASLAQENTFRSTEWTLAATAKCKKYKVPVESCF